MNALPAILACATATAAHADTLACIMDDGQAINFTIDRNQFIDAVTAEEPIRRKITFVDAGDKRFPAEPFIIADRRGFHATGLGDASVMFVVTATGDATYSNTRTGEKRFGTCEDL